MRIILDINKLRAMGFDVQVKTLGEHYREESLRKNRRPTGPIPAPMPTSDSEGFVLEVHAKHLQERPLVTQEQADDFASEAEIDPVLVETRVFRLHEALLRDQFMEAVSRLH